MFKKLKDVFAVLCSLMVVTLAALPASAAENELKINSTATAKVGDTVKYSIYMADADKKVLGITMSVFYDNEYLKLDPESIKYEKFDGAVQNPDLDGYFKFNWTQVNDEQDFSKKAMLVSAEFKVVKGGATDLSYFITDLYGNIDKFEELKSYTLTCDIAVNDEVVSKDQVPIVNDTISKEKKMQGGHINYIDGKGEENTPNKNDHQAVIVEKKYYVEDMTQVQDVTNVVSGDSSQGKGFSSVTIIVIVGILIVGLAAGAVIMVMRNDKRKNNINTDSN